jgi:hypothetical protein
MGPGGGGGAGVIWSSGASFPASVTTSVAGGANGVVAATALTVACRGQSNGATSGANGLVQANYTVPIGTSPVCTVLAASVLDYFRGTLTSSGARLEWKISDASGISSFFIERSLNQVSYETIGTQQPLGAVDFSFDDLQKWEGTVYYRLKVLFSDGTSNYSQVLPLTRYSSDLIQIVSMGPNPAVQQLNLSLFAKKTVTGAVTIVNAYGQRIYTNATIFTSGYIKIQLPLSHLAAGVYFLVIDGDNTRLVRRFVKLNTL